MPGIEASSIHSLAQDKQDLIWIGTNKGLFSYDGYSTQQHFTYGGTENTLIHSILVLDDMFLYLGTDNGVLKYNYQTDKYENPSIQYPTEVRCLAKIENKLWIGTMNGLYVYDIVANKVEQVDPDKRKGLPHQTIYSIAVSGDKSVYVGTYDGLCRYDSAKDIFETINIPQNNVRNNRFINSLLQDSKSLDVWIGTEGSLFNYNTQNKTITEIDLFRNNSVKSLTADANGNLVIGTDNGLYIYNKETRQSQHIVHDSRDIHSLSNNIIWNLFCDKENNLWIGTDYGISLFRNNLSELSIPISQITGVGDGNHFYSIFKDLEKHFWFGGTNGLILSPSMQIGSQHSVWFRMGIQKYLIPHNRVRDIYEDKDGNIWIATDGSICRYDRNENKFRTYNIVDSTHTRNSNWAYQLFEDNEGRLWIATCLGGIFVVDKAKLLQSDGLYIADINYSTSNGLSGNFINQIIPDGDGNVWVLLYNNGINKIESRTNRIEKISVEHLTNNQNPNYIIFDKEGCLWVGFRGGLVKINIWDNKSELISLDSFENNEILSMAEVDNKIWISTSSGVKIIDKNTYTVFRPDIKNIAYTSLYYDAESRSMYMGGMDEIIIVSTDKLHKENDNARVILTGLYINGKLYDNYDNKNIRYLNNIKLSYQQNNIDFDFSDLVYSRKQTDKYVYKLVGIDEKWNILAPTTNRLTYSNLKYGNYRLEISRLDISDKPTVSIFNFDLEIIPPWYYSIWAKTVYAIFLIGLIIWIINFFRVRNNLRIERIERDKTMELTRLKFDFFTNVSHEFKTPLSLIIAPVSKLILEVKDRSIKNQLEIIQRNALKLNYLISQLLEFERTESQISNTTICANIEFVEFARSLFSTYEENYERKLSFVFDARPEGIYCSIDVPKFESILNNLLSNACKYTPEGGQISLLLNNNGGLLNIIVSDTGIGIPEKDLPYIFERYYQSSKTVKDKKGTGIGLYFVKSYVELHGGRINIQSENDMGTTISISLPVLLNTEDSQTNEFTFVDNSDNSQSEATILIVEDNTEIANFIAQILALKYKTEMAHNGKQGLDMATNHQPDLIIADIMMPVMDGLEMSCRLKKLLPTSTIPIILLTAKDDKLTEMESLSLNIEAFIPKPFDAKILLLKIEQLLNSRRKIEKQMRIEILAEPKVAEIVSPDERFLSEIIQIIESKISDPDLNVNALSFISGISSKQIYRKLKQLTGMSPVEYIRFIRMKKAFMLLTQHKFTIAEVMYMVGFSNHSYFSKCFQNEFGKTPKQFLEDVGQ